MNQLIRSAIFATVLLCIANTRAQVPANVTQMDSKQFEQWVLDTASANQSSTANPEYCSAVLDRLRSQKAITDRAILRCVEAKIAFSTTVQTGGSIPPERIGTARKYIDDVFVLVADRPYLQSRLLERKGSLAVLAGDFKSSGEAFEQSLNALEPLRLGVDVHRVSTLVKLAQSLLSLHKNAEAEKYFLLALSYPWYLVQGHAEDQRAFQDQYLLAGRGLIQSRRGNLKALEEITFVPAMREELDPPLQRALGEARLKQR